MSDSVFDATEIAAVVADAPCLSPSRHTYNSLNRCVAADCKAAAIVAWLDERIFAREYRGDGSINAVIVQPEREK